jgi:NADH-quinone oxidoreductase subunit M
MPGLGNFMAEFMILAGLFKVWPILCGVAAVALVTGAVYGLWLLQRAFHGPLASTQGTLVDLRARDMAAFGVLAVGLLWLGLYPQPFIDLMAPTLNAIAGLTGG